MVIDERAYRRVPAERRALIRAEGGVAEILLRESFSHLRDPPAIRGYVGDKRAEAVDLRVAFMHTDVEHLMVVRNLPLSEDEKRRRTSQVAAVGPF